MVGRNGESEQLCQDLSTEEDDYKSEKEYLKREAQDKEDDLLVAGDAIRTMAMQRSSLRNGNASVNDEHSSGSRHEPRSKKRRINHARMNEGVSSAMASLDSAEKSRVQLAEKQDERDTKRLEIEQCRLESEKSAAETRDKLELRRIEIGEQRFSEDIRRAEESSKERQMNLEVQRSMLELVRVLQTKK